jgi:ComF family protein
VRNKSAPEGEKELGKTYFYKAFSLYEFDYMTRSLLHNYKYHSIKLIGKYLARKALDVIMNDFPELLSVDTIVAVPMHKSREDSFNHAHVLCKHIAYGLNIKDSSKQVQKAKHTDKQALLKYKDRLKSPAGSFKVKKSNDFKGKTVLIIDDIFTTGATVNELSKTLIESGATKIYVFVIAAGDYRAITTYKAKRKSYKRTMTKTNNELRVTR